MRTFIRRIQIPDLLFFSLLVGLVSLGLVMVYSASSVKAFDNFNDTAYYLKRQSVFVVAGLSLMFLILATDYHLWIKAGPWFLGLSLLTLFLIFVPGLGVRVNGAL